MSANSRECVFVCGWFTRSLALEKLGIQILNFQVEINWTEKWNTLLCKSFWQSYHLVKTGGDIYSHAVTQMNMLMIDYIFPVWNSLNQVYAIHFIIIFNNSISLSHLTRKVWQWIFVRMSACALRIHCVYWVTHISIYFYILLWKGIYRDNKLANGLTPHRFGSGFLLLLLFVFFLAYFFFLLCCPTKFDSVCHTCFLLWKSTLEFEFRLFVSIIPENNRQQQKKLVATNELIGFQCHSPMARRANKIYGWSLSRSVIQAAPKKQWNENT